MREIKFKSIDDNPRMEKIMQIDSAKYRQYTGLKDKNGKEICEGDILKWTHPDFKELKKEYKILLMSDIRKSLIIEPDCLNGWIEIIGNIYENPELLN